MKYDIQEEMKSLEKEKKVLVASLKSLEDLFESIGNMEEQRNLLVKAKEDWNYASNEWDRIIQVKEDLSDKVKRAEKSPENDKSKKSSIETANLHLKEAREAWAVAQKDYDDCAKSWDDKKKNHDVAHGIFKKTEQDWEDNLNKWIQLCAKVAKRKISAKKELTQP